jgi:hypothetical protein
MAKFELKVNVTGDTPEELADVLDLIRQQVEDGNKTGHNRNDTGQYYYEISEDTGTTD